MALLNLIDGFHRGEYDVILAKRDPERVKGVEHERGKLGRCTLHEKSGLHSFELTVFGRACPDFHTVLIEFRRTVILGPSSNGDFYKNSEEQIFHVHERTINTT